MTGTVTPSTSNAYVSLNVDHAISPHGFTSRLMPSVELTTYALGSQAVASCAGSTRELIVASALDEPPVVLQHVL